MKKMLFVWLIGLTTVHAQIRVFDANTSITDRKLRANSVYQYALPLTIMTVEVPVTKIVWTSVTESCIVSRAPKALRQDDLVQERLDVLVGNAAKRAQYFKDLTQAKPVPVVIYKIGDMILTSNPVADTTKRYWVTGKKNVLKNQKLGLTLTPDGRLSGAQTQFQDQTLAIATGVAKVAGGLLGFARTSTPVVSTDCPTVDEYKQIKKAINTLLQSQHTQSLAAQLPELRKLETSLLEQITFSEEKTVYTLKRDIVIQQGNEGSAIALLTLSPSEGVEWDYAQPTYPGSRSYLEHLDKNMVNPITRDANKIAYTIKANLLSGYPRYNITAHNEAQFTVSDGFRYNRPALASIELKKGTNPILTENVFLPQLGRIGKLPTRFSEMQFTLDPATGALLTVNQTQNAISGEALGGLGDSLGGLKPTKTTELQDLTDESGKMEQKVKYLKAKKEYEDLIKAETPPKEE